MPAYLQPKPELDGENRWHEMEAEERMIELQEEGLHELQTEGCHELHAGRNCYELPSEEVRQEL